MRSTRYADELAQAQTGNYRIERFRLRETGEEVIRFSWWKDGRMIPHPLDFTEDRLIDIIWNAIGAGVFSDDFLRCLQTMVNDHFSEVNGA